MGFLHSKALRVTAWLATAGLAAACGGSSTAPTPTPTPIATTPSVPVGINANAQRVNLLNNEIDMTWIGNGSSYTITVGRTAGASDVLNTEVTTSSYTWVTPRESGTYYMRVLGKLNGQVSGPSTDVPLSVIDLRHVIDAMIFRGGVMSDVPNNATTNPFANMYPDGTQLRVIVSNEAGQSARASAQVFLDQYAVLTGNAVTATTEMSAEDFKAVQFPGGVAANTIPMRVLAGFCGGTAVACAYYGPTPLGPGKSLVSLEGVGVQNYQAVAHEMGHAYGMGHILRPTGNSQVDLTFMMHTSVSLTQSQMSTIERTAITMARNAGLRNGMRRNDALALGLVLPYTPAANSKSYFGFQRERRDANGWTLVDMNGEQPGRPVCELSVR
jgi:hypothetical protein